MREPRMMAAYLGRGRRSMIPAISGIEDISDTNMVPKYRIRAARLLGTHINAPRESPTHARAQTTQATLILSVPLSPASPA
jgi:hypothetical protein